MQRRHRFSCCCHLKEGVWPARSETGPWMLQQVCCGGVAPLGQSRFLLAVNVFRLQKGTVSQGRDLGR